MSFRFRKSVKLCPGLKVNFSKSGASLSMGRRGATVNVSKRGLTTTLGLPGTGLAFQTRTKSGNRRRASTNARNSARVYESHQSAAYREYERQVAIAQKLADDAKLEHERQQRVASAESVANARKAKQWELINGWRNEIYYVDPDDYQAACQVFPFENRRPHPPEPDWYRERKKIASAIREQYLAGDPVPWYYWLTMIAGSLVTSTIAFLVTGGFFGGVFALLFLVGCIAGGWYAIRWWWCQEFESKVEKQCTQEWPAREQELRDQFNQEIVEYNKQVANDKAEWEKSEIDRTAFSRQLVSGDASAMDEAISSSLSDLNFAFDARCDSSVVPPHLIVINLDLPEIEDVIEESELNITTDGEMSDRKRKQSERYDQYAQLVSGLVTWVGCVALSAAPSADRVTVAAYTQRMTNGVLRDDYVMMAILHRTRLPDINEIRECDIVAFLKATGAQFETNAHGRLKTIATPNWDQIVGTAPQ